MRAGELHAAAEQHLEPRMRRAHAPTDSASRSASASTTLKAATETHVLWARVQRRDLLQCDPEMCCEIISLHMLCKV